MQSLIDKIKKFDEPFVSEAKEILNLFDLDVSRYNYLCSSIISMNLRSIDMTVYDYDYDKRLSCSGISDVIENMKCLYRQNNTFD